MAVTRAINFSDEDYEKLKAIKKKYNLKSDSATIKFLLGTGELSDEIAKKLVDEIEENYMKSERLKWATKVSEQNSIVLLDVMNTILHMLKADTLISVDFAPHPVIQKSQEKIKNKIAHFKQKSDERKRKGISRNE